MTQPRIRYGDFRRETAIEKISVNYSRLTRLSPKSTDEQRRVRLDVNDVWRILAPYVGTHAKSQTRAVLPLALYLAVFQILILRHEVADSWTIVGGIIATVAGLMLFMEGLRLGLMPLGEAIGHALPRQSTLPVILAVAFTLGIGVTYAEPSIGALKTAGAIVEAAKAPYLYAMLNQWSERLVLAIGLGIGTAAAVGMMVFVRGWSLKPIIFISVGLAVAMTVAMAADPQLRELVGLAWDCGGVATGPVTVPLVLSLGIGVASAAGKGEESMAGFGIVTLASIYPVITVLSLGLWLTATMSPMDILVAATTAATTAPSIAWYDLSPWAELVGGVRAIVPLVLFLILISRTVARTRLDETGIVAFGIAASLVGMMLLNLGLTYGLSRLGAQAGSMVPAAFMEAPGVSFSPLYMFAIGVVVALLFAWLLGIGATLAEPALNAMATTVETLTNGAFKKSTLMYAVALGVATGVTLGVAKLIFGLPLVWMLVPAYLLALAMTAYCPDDFVGMAWDSAGVATGPVTVPLVLAMGLGFGHAVGAVDGFGILAMASVCPILSVLALGVTIRVRMRGMTPALATAAAE